MNLRIKLKIGYEMKTMAPVD